MRWCDSLRDGLMYPGLCRIYSVELACLRGAWTVAAADARRACDELMAHDPRYAGQAFYLVGEMCRLTGDLDGAQEAFTRAHQLGCSPQPGLALVRLTQDRPAAAANALRLALRPGPAAPLPRAQLLAALVEAEISSGDASAARIAADELTADRRAAAESLPRRHRQGRRRSRAPRDGRSVPGTDAAARRVPIVPGARPPLRAAHGVRAMIGLATRAAGDDDSAELELASALDGFERLGARLDAERVRSLLGEHRRSDTPLTTREIEVLRLVAEGGTNKEIGAALFLSEHTVARHLSNAFTKIGVTSRAAATAYAYEHALIERGPDGGT